MKAVGNVLNDASKPDRMTLMTENQHEKQSASLIPAYRDTFVHYLFGTPGNENILLDFVNAFLDDDDQTLVKSVEAQNPFNPQTFVTDKYSILDVKATDEIGDIFFIEFQTSERKVFPKRLLYYSSRSFGSQLVSGESYEGLKAVIGIAVITYIWDKRLIRPHNSYRLTAKADPSVILTDGMQMHVLEVTEKKLDQLSMLNPPLRCWTNFFYYADKLSEAEMSTLLNGHPVVERAYGEYQRFNSDARMRSLDEAHQRYLHDLATDREAAEAKGEAKGKAEVAANMKREGLNSALIAKLTGLSVSEIERLS